MTKVRLDHVFYFMFIIVEIAESDKRHCYEEELEPAIESQPQPSKKVIKKGSMEALQNEHQEALDMLKELEMDIENRKERFQELGLEKQLPFRNAPKTSQIKSSISSSSSSSVVPKKSKARSQSTQPAVKPSRNVIPSKYINKQKDMFDLNQQQSQPQQKPTKRTSIPMERRPNREELMAAMLPPTIPRGNDRMKQSGSLPVLVKAETRKNATLISGGPGDWSSDEEDEDGSGPEA